MAPERQIIRVTIPGREPTPSEKKCLSYFDSTHAVQCVIDQSSAKAAPENLIGFLNQLAEELKAQNQVQLADAAEEVIHQCTTSADFGGYGFNENAVLSASDEAEVVFLCSAYLEAVSGAARRESTPRLLTQRPPGRRGMTMTEKVFAMHDVSRKGFVRPGDIIQVDVDWILASELSWKGMEGMYETIGKPGIFRNDRFWLAGDHRVEPELYDVPKVRALMDSAEKAKNEFKMTDFQGFNYTILHTEFVRERAQPGMLVIGADSHSCSAGSLSCLSIGMGATDVIMPLVTGQTWFTVPETVSFRLINQPPFGVGGKDIILYILKEFKKNTVAADRVVEFSGPGVHSLSCDARFAIANMCTEFGAVTGIFESDEKTSAFVNRRRLKKHKKAAVYFRPDEDAVYWKSFEIDLAKVESFVAVFPSPDNVVPISEIIDTSLDGCFIGACTTAEEDLIIAAMTLSIGLKKGWKPIKSNKRLVVPGSKPIRHKLERLGLLDIYKQAGFRVGVPGCSMCVGQGMDQAGAGEKWLSSQNRNFKNRMGPGSIANLASAATVAASSFQMQIRDPRELLDEIDQDLLKSYLGYQSLKGTVSQGLSEIQYSEPYGIDTEQALKAEKDMQGIAIDVVTDSDQGSPSEKLLKGKVMRLGDFIDTDAIAPSNFLSTARTNEELGSHCMEYFMPEFRQLVKDGQNIIVGGVGFGCGSSRDVAVNALLGAGVKCVIAKSFAFIYARNQPNIGLLGITITDEAFYATVEQGAEITVDVSRGRVISGGQTFPFQLSEMEKQLIAAGGLTGAFKEFGKQLFSVLCRPNQGKGRSAVADIENLKA